MWDSIPTLTVPHNELQQCKFPLTVQVPPFWQGLEAQSSMFISQFLPVHPAGHVQMYIATPS